MRLALPGHVAATFAACEQARIACGSDSCDASTIDASGLNGGWHEILWPSNRINALGQNMNNDIIKGKWAQMHGKLKEQWNNLTDDDVNLLDAHREYLVGKVQERYGIAKYKADTQVTEFERSLH